MAFQNPLANVDLSSLEANTLSAAGLSGLILVSPIPTANIGIQPVSLIPNTALTPGFLFHYEAENNVILESDITVHFSESNNPLQDHIALKPETIKTSGFIGEVNDIIPPIAQAAESAATKLALLAAYSPAISATANLVYQNALETANVAAAVGQVAVSAFTSITQGQTKQAIAFNQFYGWWQQRQLFKVQTPWAIFNNVAIKMLSAIQGEDTDKITNFEVTFMPMRFATSGGTNTSIMQGRLSAQASTPVNLGTSTPLPSTGLVPAFTSAFG